MSHGLIKPVLQDEALLADVNSTRADTSETLRLWWLGQSGFLVQHQGRHLLFDPYLSDSLTKKYAATDKPHVRMTERVIAPEKLSFVDVITSTHSHTDHLDAETLKPLIAANPSVQILAPVANRAMVSERTGLPMEALHLIDEGTGQEIGGISFHGIDSAHPTLERNEEGYSKYLGYIARLGAFNVYHSGDTVVYDGMVENLKPFTIDIAILPINGKVGNMNGADAARLAKAIGAGLVIPCHYEMFAFNTADPNELFIPECKRIGQPYHVLRAGEKLTLEHRADATVAATPASPLSFTQEEATQASRLQARRVEKGAGQ